MPKAKKTTTKSVSNTPLPDKVDALTAMMTLARKLHETDPKLELEKGIDIEVAAVGTFTILRTTQRNTKWTDAIRTRFAPHIDSTDHEFRKSIEIGIFADTVVIGLKSADGEVITYNDKAKRAVKELLIATPDLYEFLQIKANDGSNFLKAYEAEAKN